MNIICTGGAGFICSHLVERLVAQGHGVTVVDDLSNGSLENLEAVKDNIKFLKQDVSTPIARGWGPADVIYHLACWPRSRSFKYPRRDIEVNLMSTINILEYARKTGARVIFSSNSGIYDSTIQPIKEGNPENPTTPYDVNKLASEHMIKAYAQAYSLPYTIFRFATVYGPRQSVSSEWNPVIMTFIKTLQENKTPYITGDGRQTRDFIYVSDIVDALTLGMKGPSVGPLLLGSGDEVSIANALQIVCDVLGKPMKYETRPSPLGEIRRMSYDCTLAGETLRWTPRVKLREGVKKICEY